VNKKYVLSLLLLFIISTGCQFPKNPATSTPILITITPLLLTNTPEWTIVPTNTTLPVITESPTPVLTSTPAFTATSSVAMITPNTGQDVNCRFGPSMDYLGTGALKVGSSVPILGKLANQSWWQIESSWTPGTYCWVSASVTAASGNLSAVPVKSAPGGLVTAVSISAPATIHGHCAGPNPTSFEVSITTNGPASVSYHLAIYNGDGSLRHQTADETRAFTAASTQTFDPSGVYKTDCGDYYAKVIVTSPNEMSAQVDWTVVEP
jgi:uncharacterized protein YraI